jgi:type II secretory pathway component PulF
MSSADQPKPLSGEEARQLTEHLAALTKAGVPLAPALRAAAEEIPSRRLAEAMTSLAGELEAGRSLEMILAANPRFVPDHMRRLIETGIRSGNLSDVLVQLVDIDRTSVDLRRSIRLAVAYPLLLVALAISLVAFLAWFIIPGLRQIFLDFKMDLPASTVALIWLGGNQGLSWIFAGIGVGLIVILGLRLAMSHARWRAMILRIPLVGPMLLWRAVADWSRLSALLLQQGMSLPESLGLASIASRDAYLAVRGQRISRSVGLGVKLADALKTESGMPKSLAPLISWGEDKGALPDAFRTAGEMFDSRVQLRSALLQSVLPPIAFIVVLLVAFWLISAMMGPLVHLIFDLSGGGAKKHR